MYEERITLWEASDEDQAIEYAEKEAKDYAEDTDSEYLGFAQCYHTYEEKIGNGSEIFSLIRESKLKDEEYLNTFFDTGFERQHNDKSEQNI